MVERSKGGHERLDAEEHDKLRRTFVLGKDQKKENVEKAVGGRSAAGIRKITH